MKIQQIEPPPEGLGCDDLAPTLLYHMGVGRSQPNMIAASEALHLKSSQPGVTISQAYMFIYEMWQEYKASDRYKSQYRRKVADWLNEADYDNPPSWGGRPLPCAFQEQKPVISDVERWVRDKAAHPENYVGAAEIRALFDGLKGLSASKGMK